MIIRSALQNLKLLSLKLECLLALFLLWHTFLGSEVKDFLIADDGYFVINFGYHVTDGHLAHWTVHL